MKLKAVLLKPNPKYRNEPVINYRCKVQAFERRLREPLPPAYVAQGLPTYEEVVLMDFSVGEGGGV